MDWLRARLGEDGTYAGLGLVCIVGAFVCSTFGVSVLVLPLVIAAAVCGALAVGIPQRLRR